MRIITKFLLSKIPRPWLIKFSLYGRPVLKFIYRGNRFIDPIDNTTYRKLLPYGYDKLRKNVLSPGTLSLERHRLLWLYLKTKTSFFSSPNKLLHIAPEQPFYIQFRKLEHLDYTTLDLNSPLADIKADLTNLPFEDNTFDVILCNHVLEHISDDLQAMKELYRVMKKNGWGIFQVPLNKNKPHTYEDFSVTEPKERIKHFGQYDHVRVYGMDYFSRLKKVGFEVKPCNFIDSFSDEDIEKFCLDKKEIIPLCRKL